MVDFPEEAFMIRGTVISRFFRSSVLMVLLKRL